jgi:gamma-glutamylcyclotransferase (GGCT)/AIG2-like uncharacterized protein YtfP
LIDPSEQTGIFEISSFDTGRLINNDDVGSWRQASDDLVNEVLARINSSRSSRSVIERRQNLEAAIELFGKSAIKDCNDWGQRFPRETTRTSDAVDLVKPVENGQDDEVAINAMEELFDRIFEHPSHRLAVYGTLRPGESNAAQLEGIKGEWHDGTATGIVVQPGEYLEFTWIVGAALVAIKVFDAPELSHHFGRLDEFEGPEYVRILAPVTIEGVIQICNIYAGRTIV